MDENIILRCQVYDMMELEEFSRVDVCVCGQHIKDILYAVVGEVLVCEREPNNFQDRYALAVKMENSTCLILCIRRPAKITQATVLICLHVYDV